MAKNKNPQSDSSLKQILDDFNRLEAQKPTFLKKDLKDLSPKELQEALAYFEQEKEKLCSEYEWARDEFSSYAEDLRGGLPGYEEKIEEIKALLAGSCHTAIEESPH